MALTQYTLACHKRADGASDLVPGCASGEAGDVPGVDYCYAAVRVDVLTYHDDADNAVIVGGGALTTAVPPETGPMVDIALVVPPLLGGIAPTDAIAPVPPPTMTDVATSGSTWTTWATSAARSIAVGA